jgi:hypothetical protein
MEDVTPVTNSGQPESVVKRVENRGAGEIQTVINRVFENPHDEEMGMPPLFSFQVHFREIDNNRIDAWKLRASIEYKLNKTRSTTKESTPPHETGDQIS